ncbi:MAG: hypothetical protein IJ677_03135, partial [Alphaproteobacteria bacterium]|nr:hypothetical protein [Alphaproteobacteria bacterium]
PIQNFKDKGNIYPIHNEQNDMFRITVVSFEDRCNLNCGLRFAELLKKNRLFKVDFLNEPFPKGFLNLQGRNFFDFIDQGAKIIETYHSDIVIWGYEENGKIRINFQTAKQYAVPDNLHFSLLDSLFIPLNYFSNTESFPESLMLLIYGIIIAAINPITNEQKQNKPELLNNIITLLSENSSPKDLSREFMPFIMNMLGKVYLSGTQHRLTENDIEIIENLLSNALKYEQYLRLPIYYGCIYNSFGQLHEFAFLKECNNRFEHLKSSIKYYHKAQKYHNRNYPYDYATISFHLATLYYEFWKQSGDLQALRDAVSQMREAEKIYTLAQFPSSWSYIEGFLGYYLTCLGMETNSNDIMQLAIDCYHNKQNVCNQTRFPQEWAEIQDEIGNIYYLLGKQNNDDNFMYEARNYFNSAMDIYKRFKNKEAVNKIKQRLDKIKNYIT